MELQTLSHEIEIIVEGGTVQSAFEIVVYDESGSSIMSTSSNGDGKGRATAMFTFDPSGASRGIHTYEIVVRDKTTGVTGVAPFQFRS